MVLINLPAVLVPSLEELSPRVLVAQVLLQVSLLALELQVVVSLLLEVVLVDQV